MHNPYKHGTLEPRLGSTYATPPNSRPCRKCPTWLPFLAALTLLRCCSPGVWDPIRTNANENSLWHACITIAWILVGQNHSPTAACRMRAVYLNHSKHISLSPPSSVGRAPLTLWSWVRAPRWVSCHPTTRAELFLNCSHAKLHMNCSRLQNTLQPSCQSSLGIDHAKRPAWPHRPVCGTLSQNGYGDWLDPS